ncbi:MAG: sulfatase-like hydrolase/transferase [Methylococcales bacterium]
MIQIDCLLVILVFDTLRADFESLCSKNGYAQLPAVQKLKTLTHQLNRVRCGSFPTVPMRTDLITGQIAFLDRRWARPLPTDSVFTVHASRSGIRTRLVTDNYVMIVPKLGGEFDEFFESTCFIRGCGSDPWQPTLQVSPTLRPTRNAVLEAQFLENMRKWKDLGVAPHYRLFAQAERDLGELRQGGRFLLWIDCLSTHEPWVSAEMVLSGSLPDDEPIVPPYGPQSIYLPHQLAALSRQYAERITPVGTAIGSFVNEIEDALSTGDIALAALSDHGFLFGEYRVVGKPSSVPALPPLHDLTAWVSPHFLATKCLNSLLQPSDFTFKFSEVLDISFPTISPAPMGAGRPQLIGRNTDDAPTLTIATNEGFVLVFRNDAGRAPRWYSWSDPDETQDWESQGDAAIPSTAALGPIRGQLEGKAWINNFQESLWGLWG